MSFYSFISLYDLKKMPVDDLEIEIEKLMQQVKLMQCLIDISNKPDYRLRFINDEWHFNFCEYFYKEFNVRNDYFKCNCHDFIISGIEKLFDIVKNVFDGFNIFVLCKHFELLDISKQNLQQIDSIKDTLVNYKNDKIFMKLYKILLEPEDYLEVIQISSTVLLPILEKLKVKKRLFNNLLKKWIKHKCFVEQIQFFPHLLTLYQKYIHKYCSQFLKIKDLIEVLDNLINEQIELEIYSLYDDKGQILNSDDFRNSQRKFKGSKNIILNEIVQIKSSICYIGTLRINDEKNSMYLIPLHKYQSYDNLIGDKSKITECRNRLKEIGEDLYFINEKKGYHFSFCPNTYDDFPYDFCNCLKEIYDKKIFDVLKKYAKQFRISILNKHFEYFNFTFNSQIEVLDEIFHDKDFNDLYENLNRDLNYNVKPTIIPLLEKLKVCRDTFIKILNEWDGKSHYEIFGHDNKYQHCMDIYKSISKYLKNKHLIIELDKLDIKSKIYLERYSCKGLQKLEGNKKQVIQEILKNESIENYCEIKKFKIDGDETIYMPYALNFDETD